MDSVRASSSFASPYGAVNSRRGLSTAKTASLISPKACSVSLCFTRNASSRSSPSLPSTVALSYEDVRLAAILHAMPIKSTPRTALHMTNCIATTHACRLWVRPITSVGDAAKLVGCRAQAQETLPSWWGAGHKRRRRCQAGGVQGTSAGDAAKLVGCRTGMR